MKTKTFKTARLLVSLFFLLFAGSFCVQGQQGVGVQTEGIRFKNGVLRTERNITNAALRKDSLRSVHYNRKYYVLLQFDKLPDSAQKKEMAGEGLRLFDYVSDRSWLAEVRDSFSTEALKRHSVSSLSRLSPSFKIARRLSERPADYLQNPDKLVAVSYFGDIDITEVRQAIEATGAVIVPDKIQPSHILFVRAGNMATLQRLAALPYISYIAPQPLKPRQLNYNNRASHGATALGALLGRNLYGDGVVVGVGDNADPYTHIDFTGRLIERFPAIVDAHGTHTSGTVGGGGIYDQHTQGMAPHSTIISQYFSDILSNSPTYIGDYNMVLTNNSYTDYDYGCQYDGEYDALSYYVDAQLYSYPFLMHCFSAGNDGQYTCSPFPPQYATVKSGFQAAKNALTVGDIDNTGGPLLNNASSCGPTTDGRLKPEIVAGGTNILSTTPYNTYAYESGTSMSSPTVTGSLALLVQRYRQLHGATNPPGTLVKALACNTAVDIGNPGPDYFFGYGSLNTRAAVESMEATQYGFASVNNGGSVSGNLSVPAGTKQLRVMLYWADYPAAPYAATALVNNLDLTVTDPGALVHHPLILNPDPAHVNDNAVEGIDNVNNIEQVVINNPTAGNFNFSIKGTNVPAGPQNFVLVWQFVKPSIVVEYPFGTETLVPGQPETIRWNSYDGGTNTFKVEYSADNGSTWTTINSAVPGSARSLDWTAPAAPTIRGLIRVSRNGTAYSDVSDYPFTVLGQPIANFSNICQGYMLLSWPVVPTATSYDVMMLKGSTMQTVFNTTTTNYLLGGLNKDSTYWLAIRAVNGTVAGRRSTAFQVKPSGGACAFTALDKDFTVDSLIGLYSGRQYTSSQLGSATPISIRIKNLGTIPSSTSFNLSYNINNVRVVTEAISPVITSSCTYNYKFTTKGDFSAVGSYNLKTWVSYPGDPQHANDTVTTVIKQLNNDPVTLNPSYLEGFESAASGTFFSPTMGFTGLDRCDFLSSNSNGRARTFINTGIARTGNRCITLDQVHPLGALSADSLITTFNLGAYSNTDQLWLDFYYRNAGNDSSRQANRVWIRGNDQATWIEAYTLDTSAANIGIYQPSAHIDITGLLKNASPVQTVSSSTQIRFGEEGYTSANSVVPNGTLDDGYSFDDLTLTRSSNDIGITALLSPDPVNTCSLSNAETISIKVRNYSSSPAVNIPVTYVVNGVTVTETIPSINANDSLIYAFTQTADLSAFQINTIRAWIHYSGDNYSRNDTLAPVSFRTTPLISSYPYLEGFESNNGYWYAGGTNNSWQWGTPAKTIIDSAANGAKCWVTNLTGTYNNNEQSYLYSPCFDLSSLTSPVLSFSHIFQMEDGCDCDYHWVEYSTDGVTWNKLGAASNGTNWYDNSTRQAWQLSSTKWHVSSYALPISAAKMSFRFAMKSDEATTYEGVGIDDIHIFDRVSIYPGPDLPNGVSQPVSGTGWVNFDAGGHRIAAINPNGQDLGLTTVKVYDHTGAVRNDGTQYYLDRNIVIQPAKAPTGNVSIRYYFFDRQADSLMSASGCPSCVTIADAYHAGITQYSSPAAYEEDDSLSNNIYGTYIFHQPRQDVSVIPYDNGYYAQYDVQQFSEFWITPQAPVQNHPPAASLLSFTAMLSGSDGLLQWSTTHDGELNRFVIEKSRDSLLFSALDSVAPTANTNTTHSYVYTDAHLDTGATYYRLRLVGLDSSFTYSPVRRIDADSTTTPVPLTFSVYPNPVQRNGELTIKSPVNCRKIRLADVSGKTILEEDVQGYQFTLSVRTVAKGVYLLIVDTDSGRKVQKVFVK